MRRLLSLRWVALGVVCLAACLRLIRLGAPGLSSDEAFCWRLAGYSTGDLLARLARDVHPPAYFLALRSWVSVFGDSPVALRAPSVAFGLATLLVFSLLLREHLRNVTDRLGAAVLLGLLLVAVHPTQVAQSRNARMYALGILLAALSAWALRRAVDVPVDRRFVLYGLSLAGLAYCHYYGALTAAGQGLWAAGVAAQAFRGHDRPRALKVARGLGMAWLVSAALFLPWMPVLLEQMSMVRRGYWLRDATAAQVIGAIVEWGSGLSDVGMVAPWVLLVAILTLWATVRAGRVGLFFVLQAAVPWGFALMTLPGEGPALFLARYLAFAQLALLGLWASGFAMMRRRVEARAFALAVAGLVLFVQARVVWELPSGLSAEAKAGRFLARRGQPGDVVLVDSPWRLNRLLYYAQQEGLQGVPIRCVLRTNTLGPGLNPHYTSLEPRDFLTVDALYRLDAPRIWWGALSVDPWQDRPADWRLLAVRSFESAGGVRYHLSAYVRARRDETGPTRRAPGDSGSGSG